MGRPNDTVIFGQLAELSGVKASSARLVEALEAVPIDLRLIRYSRETVPQRFLKSFGFDANCASFTLHGLPDQLTQELQLALWLIIEGGGRVSPSGWGLLAGSLRLATVPSLKASAPISSLLDRSPLQWERELATVRAKNSGVIPNSNTLRTITSITTRIWKTLWFAYDDRSWWQREIWDLTVDSRIPRRTHEMRKSVAIHWQAIETSWLRDAARYVLKTELEAQSVVWSTALTRFSAYRSFDRFLMGRGLSSPRLVQDSSDLRSVMISFMRELQTSRPLGHRAQGEVRARSSVAGVTAVIRGFYAFAHDNGPDLARATGDRRWVDLDTEYIRFWRSGDLPRKVRRQLDERNLFDDNVMSQLASVAHQLGDDRDIGGLDDPQAMRILLLMMKTGRRISEITMLDRYPLVPVADGRGETESVAKLRYQQTKIAGAPETIFVEQEVIEIVAEQQRWLVDQIGLENPDTPYLFVSRQNNAFGTRPYSSHNIRHVFKEFVTAVGLREADGTPLRLSQTHRFRHTKATSLINLGVPLHVVQRYMGHTNPEMTMHYAQTLDSTAKAEFLKYRKVTTQGRESSVRADDLYDLMALDRRTDRILPNGWCTLPPAKSCDKGNACLSCDLFVTDKSFLGVHEGELISTESLIETRQQLHEERTGEPMGENHVWLSARRLEQKSLGLIIKTLKGPTNNGTATRSNGSEARVERDRREHQGEAAVS